MATQEQAQAVPGLELPFRPVSDVELVFPALRDFEEVRDACPSEFMSGVRVDWLDVASKFILSGGWTPARQQIACALFITDSAEVARHQVRYVSAWLGTFQPKHEEKEAIIAWLFSLMFSQCPDW